MDFNLTPGEEAFRDEVRRFLDENLPPEGERDAMFPFRWNQLIREKRWVGFGWPKEVGGGGGSIMEQAILKEEMAKRRAPPLGSCIMGLAWVGPAIIQYGTEEQKQRFLPDILDGAYQWCTGYSEPDVGSDLSKGTLLIPIERAGATAEVNQVALPASRRQVFLVPPVTRRSPMPDRAEVLSQQVANARLETRAWQHLSVRRNREQAVSRRAGLSAQALCGRVQQAVRHRRVPHKSHPSCLCSGPEAKNDVADLGVGDVGDANRSTGADDHVH